MNAKLFVRNLSWSVTENDLYALFGEVGEVLSVVIPTRREDGKPRGFAFVEMASQETGQRAIQRFNGAALHNRDLVVDFQDEERRSTGTSAPPVRSSKLFVRNVSYSASEYDLQALFQQVGTVLSVKIPIDRDTGEPKGFAFVEMGSAEEAEEAINTLNNSFLKGKEIAIDYQNQNRDRSKPRQGNGFSSRRGYGQERSGGYSGRGW